MLAETRRPATALRDTLLGLRLARDWSLREAARRIGISVQAMSALESGQRRPSPDTLARLARAYDLTGGETTALFVAAQTIPPGVDPVRLAAALHLAATATPAELDAALQLVAVARAAGLLSHQREARGEG